MKTHRIILAGGSMIAMVVIIVALLFVRMINHLPEEENCEPIADKPYPVHIHDTTTVTLSERFAIDPQIN